MEQNIRVFHIILEERGIPFLPQKHQKRRWRQIWASKESLADVFPVTEKTLHSLARHVPASRAVRIHVYPERFGKDDYIIVETLQQVRLKSSDNIIRHLGLLYGNAPDWMLFPERWQQFVQLNHGKAIDAIKNLILSLRDRLPSEIVSLAQKGLPEEPLVDVWLRIEQALYQAGVLRYVPRHSFTRTGLIAMPLKLCRAANWRAIKIRPPQFLTQWPQFVERPNNLVLLASPELFRHRDRRSDFPRGMEM